MADEWSTLLSWMVSLFTSQWRVTCESSAPTMSASTIATVKLPDVADELEVATVRVGALATSAFVEQLALG